MVPAQLLDLADTVYVPAAEPVPVAGTVIFNAELVPFAEPAVMLQPLGSIHVVGFKTALA